MATTSFRAGLVALAAASSLVLVACGDDASTDSEGRAPAESG